MNCEHNDRIMVYDGSQRGELGEDITRTVEICAACGTFFFHTDSYLETIDFEFKLIALEPALAAVIPIMVRRGLRIVSASEADAVTAKRQAGEE